MRRAAQERKAQVEAQRNRARACQAKRLGQAPARTASLLNLQVEPRKATPQKPGLRKPRRGSARPGGNLARVSQARRATTAIRVPTRMPGVGLASELGELGGEELREQQGGTTQPEEGDNIEDKNKHRGRQGRKSKAG